MPNTQTSRANNSATIPTTETAISGTATSTAAQVSDNVIINNAHVDGPSTIVDAEGSAKASAASTHPSDITATDAKVLILCGGLSHERDISLSSGHRVAGYLEDAGWNVDIHDMDGDLIDYLRNPETRPDIVWPLLHGANGEDGSIRDILELVNLPYVGSRAKASFIAWNKPIAKNIVRKRGNLSTPHSVTLPESMFRELGARKIVDILVPALGLPLFIKPTMGGSALGCTLVETPEMLPQALVSCFAYGDTALIEKAVIGTEVAVSIIDIDGSPQAFSPLEIHTTASKHYDYDARYNGPTEYYVPARLSDDILENVKKAALTAHQVIGLRDISRIDFIVDDSGIPQFLEANVAPGMTETSILPQEVLCDGHKLADLYSSLVKSVLSQNRVKA